MEKKTLKPAINLAINKDSSSKESVTTNVTQSNDISQNSTMTTELSMKKASIVTEVDSNAEKKIAVSYLDDSLETDLTDSLTKLVFDSFDKGNIKAYNINTCFLIKFIILF